MIRTVPDNTSGPNQYDLYIGGADWPGNIVLGGPYFKQENLLQTYQSTTKIQTVLRFNQNSGAPIGPIYEFNQFGIVIPMGNTIYGDTVDNSTKMLTYTNNGNIVMGGENSTSKITIETINGNTVNNNSAHALVIKAVGDIIIKSTNGKVILQGQNNSQTIT